MPTISTLTVDVNANTTRFRTGIRAAGIGLTALAGAAVYAFKQFEDAQKITAQTNAVLESTGGVANVTAKDVDKLANALSRKSGIDDETIQSGENLLLTFTNIRNETGKGNDIFNRATETILDMSVALGTDLKSASIQVGKALQDPTVGLTALRRVGVNFNEQQTEMIQKLFESGNQLRAQKLILRELAVEFEGSAEAQKTASATLGVAFGNLAERVGGLLAPAITFLIEEVTGLVKTFQKDVGPAFAAAVEWLGKVWNAVKPVAVAFGRELMEALSETWAVIRQKLWPALKDLFEALGPILKVVGQVIGVVVMLALEAIPVLVEELATWIDFLARVIEAAKNVVNFISEKFVGPIVRAIEAIITWIQRAIGWVSGKFVAAWDASLGPIMDVINTVVDAVKTLIGWIQSAVEWLGRLGSDVPVPRGPSGAPAAVPHLNPPQAQTGGFVARSGLAIIHRGETITPAGRGGITINVQGWVGDEAALTRKIEEMLNRNGRRNGGRTLLGAT